MTALHLSRHFASQSELPIDNGRGRVLWLDPHGPPATVTGLLPRRHYRVEGATTGFIRTDERGQATLPIVTARPALVALWPVV